MTGDSPDFGHLQPMIRAARDELHRAGVEQPPDVVLADAGYWHQVQMERLVSDGMRVLIPPDAKQRAGTRPGWNGGLYTFMRRVLETDAGGELYAKRQTMIEPIFADITGLRNRASARPLPGGLHLRSRRSAAPDYRSIPRSVLRPADTNLIHSLDPRR